MNMLTKQCDELRELATRFDGIMPQNATILRNAADTILSLRSRIHDDMAVIDKLKEDKAELRELCGMLHGRLRAAEEATEMGWIDARLNERMRECGMEVAE